VPACQGLPNLPDQVPARAGGACRVPTRRRQRQIKVGLARVSGFITEEQLRAGLTQAVLPCWAHQYRRHIQSSFELRRFGV